MGFNSGFKGLTQC